MNENPLREKFDTGKRKIRVEIKSRLVPHGLFALITDTDGDLHEDVPAGARIEIITNGRSVGRWFGRAQIEACCLRVGGEVLASITAMIEEVSAPGGTLGPENSPAR